MGWRGLLRDLQAASRQAERDAYRRRRALEKQQQQYDRMEASDRVRYEVEVYENQMELLVSVHKECGEQWDWQAVKMADRPAAPKQGDDNERKAEWALARYTPGVWDRLSGQGKAKAEELREAIDEGRLKDKQDYQRAIEEHQAAVSDWQNSRNFAARILSGDLDAYLEAIKETSPLGDLSILGSSIRFGVLNANAIEVDLRVNGEAAIPSEVKAQLSNGQLSVKPMSKQRFYEVYQDYVCGSVFRVARELFALLPVNMVIVTALGSILNSATGHLEEKPVLSVAVPRDTCNRIRWESVDPSDTMANFVHRMCFKKGKGLFAVEPVLPSEVGL